ncbi:MAG: tripartite tricarboxylate transporter substrate binding protein [Betaproteobacteria bacterium]|nr:tripartite tricarboxylate transporter substrate binding protein [Betaproteobacteria bacterium]
MKRTTILGVCAALALAAGSASGQAYPDRPIRMVIPYPPGGAIDTVARRIVQEWVGRLGQQIVVDNRGGAGGTIGTELVAKAPPTGYTILYGNIGPLSIGPHMYKQLGYDVFKDFAPVTLAASAPFVLFSSTTLPVRSVKELVAYARARPGQLNYASSGMGSGLHLTSELFARVASIQIVHVPFKGIGVAIPEIAAGRVHILTYPYSGAAPHVKAGRLRPLMSGGTRRSPHYPDVPTAAEVGMPGFHSTAWHAVVAPAGTPQPAVLKLQQTFAAAVAAPALRKVMAVDDVELVASSPAELARFLRAENDKWEKVIRSAGIKVD